MARQRSRSAGTLFYNVRFERPTEIDDGHGGVEVGWAAVATARANYRYLRGGETVQASRLSGVQPVVITVRDSCKLREITTGARAIDVRTGAVMNIRSGPVPSDDRRFIEFTAESGVAV